MRLVMINIGDTRGIVDHWKGSRGQNPPPTVDPLSLSPIPHPLPGGMWSGA